MPCIVADDLTPEQIKAFRLADNKVGELAQWDTVLLAVELDELAAAKDLAIPFYADAVIAKDRNRIEPVFTLEVDPRERNVLIFDDIITTGQTARTIRELLLEKGHVVLIAAGIKN